MKIAVRRLIGRQEGRRSAHRRRVARQARGLPLRTGPLAAFVFSLLIAGPGLPARGGAAEGHAHATEVAQLDGDRDAGPPRVLQTPHDLSLDGAEPCRYCHLARQGEDGVTPRWDRQQTAAMYFAYGGVDGLPATKWRPQGVSQVCLSCHDGTIGPDRTVETVVGVVARDPINNPQMGTVFLTDHPVSVAFRSGRRGLQVAKRGYAGALPFFGDLKERVECASCHNAHYETYQPFLRPAAVRGNLCRSCHVK